MEEGGQFEVLAAVLIEQEAVSAYGRFVAERDLLLLPTIEPRYLDNPAHTTRHHRPTD